MNRYNTNLNLSNYNNSHTIAHNPLTKNGLKQLFQLENVDKKVHAVDLKMQVMSIKKNENNKNPSNNKQTNEIYTAGLSDGELKYTGFIIFRDNSIRTLEEGDVIRVLNVSSALLNQQKSRVFLIKKYEICEHYPIIGNPELIKEENESKEKFPQKGVVGHPKREDESSNKLRYNEEESKATVKPIPNKQVPTTNQSSNQDNSNKYYACLSHLTTFSKDIRLLVRVVKKTEIKTWNNFQNKTSGSLFSFTMMDQEGTEMQATAFNKQCDKFYNEIQEQHVYEITGGYIRINDKKFSTVKADYKLVFDENTRVVPKEDDGTIQEQVLSYVKLSDLVNLPPGSIVDVLVYLIDTHERQKITTKLGEASLKRLVVGDASSFKCEFTMWKANLDHEFVPGKILSIKSAKIGEFNGRNIFSVDDTVITFDPLCPEANELRSFLNTFDQNEWRSLTVNNATGENNQSLVTKDIAYMKEVLEQLDNLSDDKIGMSTIKATICSFNHSEKNFYAGCPEIKCKKKLTKETYDYVCPACQKTIPKPMYYYTLSIRLKDSSTEHWVDIFGQLGDKLFKINCEEYKDLIINKDEVRLREISNQLEFKTFYFLCKAKNQMYNNIPKKKLNVYRIEIVDNKSDSRRIIKGLDVLMRR